MGAQTFYNRVKGKNADELFHQEKQEALYEEGHGRYTGTIAEKDGFKMSNKPSEIDSEIWVEMLDEFDISNKKQRHYWELKKDFLIYDNKMDNALCVPTEDGFIFCGWASS